MTPVDKEVDKTQDYIVTGLLPPNHQRPDFGSEGWGFESLQARHFSQFVAVMSPLF
jgi:hypothetical protein